MDRVTKELRSRNMSRIRAIDTTPELAVRRFLHAKGLRYRLHVGDLPGKPDIVFPSRGVCVFVHGCFWHGCERCKNGIRKVRSNTVYWSSKIAGNRSRDALNEAALLNSGWTVFVIWECEVKNPERLQRLANAIIELPKCPSRRTPRNE